MPYISVLYLYKNLWAYNTSWAYNTYYTVRVTIVGSIQPLQVYILAELMHVEFFPPAANV